jgi:hypothetical protein
MSSNEGIVGLATPRADGSTVHFQRLSNSLAQIVTQAHGRCHEAASRGALFAASLQAGTALGTALTATAVTFTLYNPAGSNVLLSIQNCAVGITTAPAGSAVIVYASNHNVAAAVPSSVTALASGIRTMPLGTGSGGRGIVYSAATLPAAPVAVRVHSTILATGSTAGAILNDDVGGAIVLAPNSAVTIQSIGTAVSGIVSMTWEEIPYI